MSVVLAKRKEWNVDQSLVRAPVDIPSLFSLSIQLPEFAKSWQHCDSVANFLGKAVSGEKEDSFRYENMVSTIVNEVLESLFHHHGGGERAVLAIGADGPWLEFSALLSPDAATESYFRSATALVEGGGIVDQYERMILDHDSSPPGLAGLLEIAASYGAQIRVASVAGALPLRVSVAVDMERLLKE